MIWRTSCQHGTHAAAHAPGRLAIQEEIRLAMSDHNTKTNTHLYIYIYAYIYVYIYSITVL